MQQNKDHNLRYSSSDSSEKLLQRGGVGEVSIYVILVKGEYMHSSIYFFLLVTRSSFIMKDFSAFLKWAILVAHLGQKTPWGRK